MLNRKIAISAVSIFAAFALVAGGTFAFFSDTSTSTNNIFSTGNANLEISLDTEGTPTAYLNTIPGFSATDIAPGFSQNYVFWLRNASSSVINLNNVLKFTDVTGDETLQDQLTAGFQCETRGTLTVTNAGPFSINAMEAGSVNLGSLTHANALPDASGDDETKCTMTVSLPSSSELSGVNTAFNMLVTGTQL